MATLTGTIYGPGGAAYHDYLRFTLRAQPRISGTTVIDGERLSVQTANNGYFTTALPLGTYWVEVKGGTPFEIALTTDGTHDISDLITIPAATATYTAIYLFNEDTHLYHKVDMVGTSPALGLTLNPVGVADPPSSVRMTSLLLWNADESRYRTVTCVGVGDEIGLQFS